MQGPRQLPPTLEKLVLSHYKKTRGELRSAGVLGFVLMLALAAVTYLALDPPQQNLWVMAAGAAPLVLALAIPSLLDPRKAKAFRILSARSDEIVWIYVRQITGSQRGAFVALGLCDGKLLQVPCVVGREDELLGLIATYVPHAAGGFSPTRAAQFKANPAAMPR
jgi:hypothetical protein